MSTAERFELARAQQGKFWSKVDKSGPCWLWTARRDPDGYGKFQLTRPRDGGPRRVHVRAHRLSLALSLGEWPADSLVTMHACDVPGCVNPAHLSPDTHRANMADCVAKGRVAHGEAHYMRRRAAARRLSMPAAAE